MARARSVALIAATALATVAVVQTVRVHDAQQATRHARSAAVALRAERAQLTTERNRARADLDAAREQLDDVGTQPAETSLVGDATPIVEQPAGVALCRPEELEVANNDPAFIRLFNRSGHRCALLDYPALIGTIGGRRQVVMTYPLAVPGYSDGPSWTGVFDPKLTAVLSFQTPTPDAHGRCATGRAEKQHVERLELILAGQTSALALGDASLEIAGCRPAVSTFAYDSTDI